jgi:hypothetical protein
LGAERARRDRALYEGLERCDGFTAVSEAKLELHAKLDELIARAHREGAIRAELDARDLGALVGAAIQAAQHAERDDAWRRYVRVVLDGLRP